MSMICNGNGGNNGNPTEEETDEKYRLGLINTATYINIMQSLGLTMEEINEKIAIVRPNRLWETRNDCD